MPAVSPTALWGWWMLTFVAFPLGGGIAYVATRSLDGLGRTVVGGVISGLIIGMAQWLVLRRAFGVETWWIPATGGGLALGLGLGALLAGTGNDTVALVLRAVVAGALVGLTQWTVLRQHVPMAGAWIVATGGAWAAGWMVTRAVGVDLSRGWTVFGASGAFVFVALTGLALIWLLRRS